MTCTACTATLEPGAVFCGECGERVRQRADTLTGTLLDDRFRIDAKIAAGGFGAVYRATRVRTGTVVALKVLHADLAIDSNLSARFRREAAALARLRDEHTVTTYEFGEAEDGTLFIAMELLRGESLFERFRSQGPLPWRRMVSIALGVCSSLSEAHRLGIVHRDLKPANIHLESGDFAKVIDFGIAKLLDTSDVPDKSTLTRVGQAIGTIDYMSPEQLVGSNCDGRTDIYTLGVVMYEMITGRRPFADATGPMSLVSVLMTQRPVTPSKLFGCHLPADLDKILLRCLELDPVHRFATIDELAAALKTVLVQHPAPRAQPAQHATRLLFGGCDDEEITQVDWMPPQLAEPPTAPSRIPRLDVRPTWPAFDAFAEGSKVDLQPALPEIWLLVLLTKSVHVALEVSKLL